MAFESCRDPGTGSGDSDEVTAVGGGDLGIEALERAFPGVVVVAGLSTGWVVPGRGHGCRR